MMTEYAKNSVIIICMGPEIPSLASKNHGDSITTCSTCRVFLGGAISC